MLLVASEPGAMCTLLSFTVRQEKGSASLDKLHSPETVPCPTLFRECSLLDMGRLERMHFNATLPSGLIDTIPVANPSPVTVRHSCILLQPSLHCWALGHRQAAHLAPFSQAIPDWSCWLTLAVDTILCMDTRGGCSTKWQSPDWL